MPGPDPCSDIVQTTPDSLDENFEFTSTEGMPYQEFLERIHRVATNQGRSRDSAWMADLAALHFSGAALKWYESLEGDVQEDWHLLRKAIAQKYGDEGAEGAGTIANWGNSVLAVWHLLRKAMTQNYGDEGAEGAVTTESAPDVKEMTPEPEDPNKYLLPARVEVINWGTPVLASSLRFPKSEGEWMNEARQRKAKLAARTGAVYWRLVETWEPIPRDAIPAGNEKGTQAFSIRVWKDGGLTIGKQIPAAFWNNTRAWIPWQGKELQWSGPFEILVGDRSAVRWVSPRDTGRFYAVEGGFELWHTNALFVSQSNHQGVLVAGKTFSADYEGRLGWWGQEVYERDFRILAWA
ncbi:hypothetical protein FRC04_002052 [Tulasnella sp. 424]|nr:hypothetical protein FRC04_002052 [Tulasnella sp. 424]KAG8975554.1 hypothetical protein FRC05_005623 [Tulasnella sp. 425]